LWNSPNDARGQVSVIDLYDKARETLAEIINGNSTKRERIFHALFEEAKSLGEWVMLRSGDWMILQALPMIYPNKGRIAIRPGFFITGVHAVVVYGLMEILERPDRLARCDNKECRKFYLKTPKLRVACSDECRRALRRKEARDAMDNLRKKRRRASGRKSRAKSRSRRRKP